MKFLVISDIHGDLDNLDKLDACFKEADAVLFGGDYAKFEHLETAKPVLEKLTKKHENVFSVLGNCDSPDFLSEIEGADVSVEASLAFFEGTAICGSGGGTKFTGTTPFEREEDEIISDYNVVEDSSAECADENGHWSNLVIFVVVGLEFGRNAVDHIAVGIVLNHARDKSAVFVEQVQRHVVALDAELGNGFGVVEVSHLREGYLVAVVGTVP